MTSVKLYLGLNAALYALFALWCTVLPARTAASLGYIARNAAGQSEYLVIYGGLQWGLAAFFAYAVVTSALMPVALTFAILLYVPIVAYRFVTVLRFWPVAPLTRGVAVLEFTLMVWALGLALQRGRAM